MHSSLDGIGRIGIVGVGAVGGAVRSYIEALGVAPLLFDPGKRLGSLEEIDAANLVFVCVPTPYTPVIGFDDSAVADVLETLGGSKTVVIKSTVLPGTTRRFQAAYPQHRILFNPEFLREASAAQDFIEPDRQIVGICDEADRELACRLLALLPSAPHESVVAAEVAELTKYATNAFLALKVIFANEIYDLSDALSIDYEEVKRGLTVDARIGDSHMEVLHAGYRGYGGKCLPKDVAALLDLAEELGAPLPVLQAAHNANLRLKTPTPLQSRHGRVPEEADKQEGRPLRTA